MIEKPVLQIDQEFKNLISPLTPDEYRQLEKNIIKDGCLHELIIWETTIIDGHNRYEICQKHGILFKVKNWSFDSREDAKEWIIRNQFGRRNISINQRSLLALQLDDIVKARAKGKQKLSEGRGKKGLALAPNLNAIHTDKELAKVAGVSPKTIQYARVIKREGTDEQRHRFESGESKAKTLYKEIRKSKPSQKTTPNKSAETTVDFSFLAEDYKPTEEDKEFSDLLNSTVADAELLGQFKDAVCVPVVSDYLVKAIKEKLTEYPDTAINVANPDRKAFVNVFNILKKIIKMGSEKNEDR